MLLADLPAHCFDAVDAAERARSRTLITRGGQAIAAIVPIADLDALDPPDPGAGGLDPLLGLCGACHDDEFVDALLLQGSLVEDDFDSTTTAEDMQATHVADDLQATRAIDEARLGRAAPATAGRRPPRPRS